MDTTLSNGELVKAKKQFEEFDVDGDGVVSWDDYIEYLTNKKRNALRVKLIQKQKVLLQKYEKYASDAFKHFREDTHADGRHSPKKNKKPAATSKKKKKRERKLTPEEQAELARLDPFAPGHSEAEKARIWARINEIVGADEESEGEDSDSVEKVSFSESETESAQESKSDRVESSNDEEAKEQPKKKNLAKSTPSSPQKPGSRVKQNTSKDKDKSHLMVSPRKNTSSENEGNESKKPFEGIKRSASSTASQMSKKSSKLVANVLKKAEEGAKAAKSRIIKEDQQAEQVQDPDDPALFASAYKNKNKH